MATLEELSTALINADKAGDVDAARVLAGEIQRMKSAAPKAAPYRGTILPFEIDESGQKKFAMPGILRPAERGGQALYDTKPQTTISDSDVGPLTAGVALEGAAMLSPLPPGMRTGIPMSTAADIKAAAQRGYNSPAVSELRINPAGPSRLADHLIAEAEKKGLRPDNPGEGVIYNRANELRGLPSATSVPKGETVFQPEIAGPGYQMGQDIFKRAPVTVQDLTAVRTALGSPVKTGTDALTGSMNPSAARASDVRSGITDYLNKIPKSDVVAGDAEAAGAALSRAGADYAASKKLQILDALQHRAELRTGAANSGQNINNNTRQEVKNFILNQRASRGLSDAEASAAENAVMGTFVGNRARGIANKYDPSGSLSLPNTAAAGGIGAYLGPELGLNPSTAAIVAALGVKGIGKVARGVANSSEQRAFDNFRQIVLEGSPSAREEMGRQSAQSMNAAIARALLFGGVGALSDQ